MYFQHIQPYIEYILKTFPQHPIPEDMGRFTGIDPLKIRKDFRAWSGLEIKEFIQHLTFILARRYRRNSTDHYSLPEYQPAVILHAAPRIVNLHFAWIDTKFGQLLLAATDHGVAAVLFDDQQDDHSTTPEMTALRLLKRRFPNAEYVMKLNQHISDAIAFFSGDTNIHLNIHLNTTEFRLQVYQALLKIPPAQLRTYAETAQFIGKPRAVRAVGNAVAANPLSLIIPCHRIVPSAGGFGNYYWGSARKMALLGWEAIAENRYISTAIRKTTTKKTPL